jgi:type II secretory pathway pseudopilin PulG
MKQFRKSMLGVTLLEIMLVLAIAAMVIVMSIRYYQSATSSQQANSALAQIQSITAAADSIAQGAGGYTTSTISASNISPLLPKNGLVTPWNGGVAFSNITATKYTVTLSNTPAAVCPILKTKLAVNSHYDVTATTCTGGIVAFAYTYSSS